MKMSKKDCKVTKTNTNNWETRLNKWQERPEEETNNTKSNKHI